MGCQGILKRHVRDLPGVTGPALSETNKHVKQQTALGHQGSGWIIIAF